MNKFLLLLALVVITTLLFTSCSKKENIPSGPPPNQDSNTSGEDSSGGNDNDGNGDTGEIKASFDVSISEESLGEVTVKNTSTGNYSKFLWDMGNGTDAIHNEEAVTVTYAPGTYTITLILSEGNEDYEASQTITIEDKGQLIKGGAMTEDDESVWNFFIINDNEANYEFTSQGLVIKDLDDGSNLSANNVFYQAIEVEKDVTYQMSMTLKGDGMFQSWLNVYFSSQEPEEGIELDDLEGANRFYRINAWLPACAVDPYNGDITTIGADGCDGNGVASDGKITFSESGTAYIILNVGTSKYGWGENPDLDPTFGDDGLTINNVSLRPAE